MVYCSDCGCDRARRDFSTRQLKKEYPRCYDCTQGGDSSYGQERSEKWPRRPPLKERWDFLVTQEAKICAK